jgi:hypothetical protein
MTSMKIVSRVVILGVRRLMGRYNKWAGKHAYPLHRG